MLQINSPRLLDKVEKRLKINLLKVLQAVEIHMFCTHNMLSFSGLRKNDRATLITGYKKRTPIARERSFCYRIGPSMDRVIQSICGMLQSPDGMRRCAAAMVLAELRPKEAAVVKALGDALKDANQLLTRYVLEAFEAIGSRSVVPYVLPLLEAPEIETKLRAAAIIARSEEHTSELQSHSFI